MITALGDVRTALMVVGDPGRTEAERAMAATRLGELGAPEAVLPLAIEYGDSFGSFRTALAYALGRLNAIEVIERELSYGDARTRARAAEVLALFHDPRSTRVLVGALTDPNLDVRINAACALAEHKSLVALPALADRLRDDTAPQVRAAAAQAIGVLPGIQARDTLEAATQKELEVFVIIVIERTIQKRIDRGEHDGLREAV